MLSWQSGLKRRLYVWYLESVIQWDCYSSCVKVRCQETASGDCNRLRTLVCVCQWSLKCSHESWVYKRSINRVTNPNPVNSHTLTRDDIWMYILILILAESSRLSYYFLPTALQLGILEVPGSNASSGTGHTDYDFRGFSQPFHTNASVILHIKA
jgi:hypothetical protein